MKLLITGGVARFLGEFKSHGKALKNGEIAVIDFEKKTYEKKLTYVTPPELAPDNEPSIGFTSASIYQDQLYVSTSTQVLVIHLPEFRILRTIDHPSFHDIHHVTVINNYIYVAVTGLDAVFKFSDTGEFIEAVNVVGKPLWHRYHEGQNLRKVTSTKPHDSHPNYIFNIGERIWVTRFEQGDAVNLGDLNDKIKISTERIHDGFVTDDKIYFTSVNGHVIIVDAKEKKIIKDIDLNKIDPRKNHPLGWCRGIYVEGDFAYVGFTQLRSTSFTENLRWIKQIYEAKKLIGKPLSTRISKYNLATAEFVDEITWQTGAISALFGILKYDF